MACGLLSKFEVSSDLPEQLEAAISITLPWNRSGAKAFRVGVTEDGFDWIEFSSRADKDKDFSPLPYPLDTLSKFSSFARDWLSTAQRGEELDTDGSCSEGWIVTQPNMRSCWESAWLRIQTTWIIYGK